MKAWLRRLSVSVLLLALALMVNRGRTQPEPLSECGTSDPGQMPVPSPGEPPMVGAPKSPPFLAPSPTLLPPGQAGTPFVPGMPFVPPEGREPPEPVVRLRVQAPARSEPDKEIEYRLTVENVSQAEAHHVLVRDRLPKGVDKYVRAEPKPDGQPETKNGFTDLLWKVGTLKGGEQKTIVLVIKPPSGDEVSNSAYVQFEHGQSVTTQMAKPSVRLKATAPAQAFLYQAVTFRLEVTNTGTALLREVAATDELPAELEFVNSKPQQTSEKPFTWKLGDIPPGETRHIEYQVVCKQTGTFRNKAQATAAGGLSAADSATITVGEQKLKIGISGPGRRAVNRPIPYHITVSNLGSVPLTNVQVSDEIPRAPKGVGFELVHLSPGGRQEGGSVHWALGTMSPGERRSLLLVLRAPAPGWCWNAATVRADKDLTEKATSEATHIDAADRAVLEIDKSTATLIVGQKANYTIRFVNLSKLAVLNAPVTVTVPEELSVVGMRGPTTGTRNGQSVHFASLKLLDKGEEQIYTVEVEAKKAGKAKLQASCFDGIKSPSDPLPTWEDTLLVVDPAPAVGGKPSVVSNRPLMQR